MFKISRERRLIKEKEKKMRMYDQQSTTNTTAHPSQIKAVADWDGNYNREYRNRECSVEVEVEHKRKEGNSQTEGMEEAQDRMDIPYSGCTLVGTETVAACNQQWMEGKCQRKVG